MNIIDENEKFLDINALTSIIWLNKRYFILGFYYTFASCLFLLNSEKTYQVDAVLGINNKSNQSSNSNQILGSGNSMLSLFGVLDSEPSGEVIAKLSARTFLLKFINDEKVKAQIKDAGICKVGKPNVLSLSGILNLLKS